MGILADFFVAELDDALNYQQLMGPDLPRDRFELVESGRITPLEVTTLWAITTNEQWSPEQHDLEMLGESSAEQETWLCRFPPAFVSRLAELTPAELPRVAAEWAATEEMACSPEDVLPEVDGLVRLARLAQTTGKGLYLWGSL